MFGKAQTDIEGVQSTKIMREIDWKAQHPLDIFHINITHCITGFYLELLTASKHQHDSKHDFYIIKQKQHQTWWEYKHDVKVFLLAVINMKQEVMDCFLFVAMKGSDMRYLPVFTSDGRGRGTTKIPEKLSSVIQSISRPITEIW